MHGRLVKWRWRLETALAEGLDLTATSTPSLILTPHDDSIYKYPLPSIV